MLSNFFKSSAENPNSTRVLDSEYGVYGKIPSVGDFFSRGLPRQDIVAVDHWLQEGMVALQALRDDWQATYLIAPVWRFLIPAGVLGSSAKSGLVMASVDKIGRYFPIVVLASHEQIDDRLLLKIGPALHSLSVLLPRVIYERLAPDLLFAEIVSLLGELSESTGSNEAYYNIHPTKQRSYWWAVNQQGLKTSIQHAGALNAELFKKLFGVRCEFL